MQKYKQIGKLKQDIKRTKNNGEKEFIAKGTDIIIQQHKNKDEVLIMIADNYGDTLKFTNVNFSDIDLYEDIFCNDVLIPNLINKGFPEILLQQIG